MPKVTMAGLMGPSAVCAFARDGVGMGMPTTTGWLAPDAALEAAPPAPPARCAKGSCPPCRDAMP